MEVEQAVATFIDRVNDLLAVLNAERGNRLTRTEYLRWMVPISQAWEVIFDHASQVPDTDLDSLVSGTETDRNRALQLLHQIVCNELPMAALAATTSRCSTTPPKPSPTSARPSSNSPSRANSSSRTRTTNRRTSHSSK